MQTDKHEWAAKGCSSFVSARVHWHGMQVQNLTWVRKAATEGCASTPDRAVNVWPSAHWQTHATS